MAFLYIGRHRNSAPGTYSSLDKNTSTCPRSMTTSRPSGTSAALELDPTLAAAYAWLSYAIVLGMLYFEGEPGEERLNEAVALARRSVELDDQDV
jgi:hypothetical protein